MFSKVLWFGKDYYLFPGAGCRTAKVWHRSCAGSQKIERGYMSQINGGFFWCKRFSWKWCSYKGNCCQKNEVWSSSGWKHVKTHWHPCGWFERKGLCHTSHPRNQRISSRPSKGTGKNSSGVKFAMLCPWQFPAGTKVSEVYTMFSYMSCSKEAWFLARLLHRHLSTKRKQQFLPTPPKKK